MLLSYQMERQLAEERGIDDARAGLPRDERMRNRCPEVPAWNLVMWTVYATAYAGE